MIPVPEGINWENKLNEIAEKIRGFSGREIAKLLISWQVSKHVHILVATLIHNELCIAYVYKHLVPCC